MIKSVAFPKFIVAEYFDGSLSAHSKIYKSLGEIRDTLEQVIVDCFSDEGDEPEREKRIQELHNVFAEIGTDEESKHWEFTIVDSDFAIAMVVEE